MTRKFELLPTDAPLLERMPLAAAALLQDAAGGDCSYTALATMRQVPIGTVKSRLNRARNLLEALRARPRFVIAATEIIGGELAVCEGDAHGKIVARFPRTDEGRAAALQFIDTETARPRA